MKRHNTHFKHPDACPYFALWAAVINQAVADMESYRQGDKRSAERWIFSPADAPGSFVWVCDMLDLDAGRLQTLCMTREGRRSLLTKNHGNQNGRGRRKKLDAESQTDWGNDYGND